MGLYGAAIKNNAANQIYAGIAHDTEVTLLYSEIDPLLHAAVANGTYGTASYPSTINYMPKYFLVNGTPYSTTTAPLAAGNAGGTTLIRFLNAALQSHVPMLQGQYMNLVAEDGNVYPYAHKQYSVLLAPGKTKDAIFTPTSAGNFAITDRRLSLTNGITSNAGMISFLQVGAALP